MTYNGDVICLHCNRNINPIAAIIGNDEDNRLFAIVKDIISNHIIIYQIPAETKGEEVIFNENETPQERAILQENEIINAMYDSLLSELIKTSPTEKALIQKFDSFLSLIAKGDQKNQERGESNWSRR